MTEITREHALFNIRTLLKAFKDKIEKAKEYTEYLSVEGKEIVRFYENNNGSCKNLLHEAAENPRFFDGLSNEELVEYVNICCELNKVLGLRIKNLCKVTKIREIGEYKLICLQEKTAALPCSKKFSVVKINGEKVNLLTALIKRVDWQLLDSNEKVVDEMFFKDIIDMSQFTRTIRFSDKGKYTVRARIYTADLVPEILTDVLEYKLAIAGNEIDLSLYDKSWVVVKNENGQIEKIIFNNGNGITFVNRFGEVTGKVPFDRAYSKTQFLNRHLGISSSNEILKKAGYSYDSIEGMFIESKNGAKRCFDLNGNEAPFEFDIRQVKNKVTFAGMTVSNNLSFDSTRNEIGITFVSNADILGLNENNRATVSISKVPNRFYQNDLRPDKPNGPCYFRSLLAAIEEKLCRPYELNEMLDIAKICWDKRNNYLGDSEDEYTVQNPEKILETALTYLGYTNSEIKYSVRSTSISGNSDCSIRFIKSKNHFQLGDSNGNLLWDPYKYNNESNAFKGKADLFNEITIYLGENKSEK